MLKKYTVYINLSAAMSCQKANTMGSNVFFLYEALKKAINKLD